MFPFVYGFTWDLGNIIFLGLFFTVVTLIMITLIRTAIRSMRTMTPEHINEFQWHAGFEELPASARLCRHALTGEAPGRRCNNAFACDHCQEHLRFQHIRESASNAPLPQTSQPFQAAMDRFYHRGHTWVRSEADGTVTIGLDPLASRLLAQTDGEVLPESGSAIHRNGNGWFVKKGNGEIVVLAPVSGTVIEAGKAEDDWKLRVKPNSDESMEPLLHGEEVNAWLRGEFERFQRLLAVPTVGATLADGGVPADDLSSVIPAGMQEQVYADMFLQP